MLLTTRPQRPLSSLALDLAKSRVGLAALKLQVNEELTAKELQSVRALCDHFARLLTTMNERSTAQPESVDSDPTRAALRKKLAEITQPQPQVNSNDLLRLQKLVDNLQLLAQERTLDPGAADELWISLRKGELIGVPDRAPRHVSV